MAVIEVGVTEFRADLRRWIDRVKSGEEIVLTERRTPIARITSINALPVIEQLERDGLIRGPRNKSRTKASGRKRVQVKGSVSEIITQQRN